MKSESRVPKMYRKGTKDWEEQYNMLHDDGATCADCRSVNRCKSFGFTTPDSDRCDFYPNRFKAAIAETRKEPIRSKGGSGMDTS